MYFCVGAELLFIIVWMEGFYIGMGSWYLLEHLYILSRRSIPTCVCVCVCVSCEARDNAVERHTGLVSDVCPICGPYAIEWWWKQ
jgi:hypothetical protein